MCQIQVVRKGDGERSSEGCIMVTTPFHKKMEKIGSFCPCLQGHVREAALTTATFKWVEYFSIHTVPMGQQLQLLEGSRFFIIIIIIYWNKRRVMLCRLG